MKLGVGQQVRIKNAKTPREFQKLNTGTYLGFMESMAQHRTKTVPIRDVGTCGGGVAYKLEGCTTYWWSRDWFDVVDQRYTNFFKRGE